MNSGPVIDLTAVAPRPPVVGWLIIDWLGNWQHKLLTHILHQPSMTLMFYRSQAENAPAGLGTTVRSPPWSGAVAIVCWIHRLL